MKKEVNISINTDSYPANDDPRHIAQETTGTVFFKDELLYITYNENPEEFGKTTTTLKIKPDRLELIRTGNVMSRLVFRKDIPYEGGYNTPYGTLPVKISVHSMNIRADENSGDISMSYLLDFAGDITENKFTFKYNQSAKGFCTNE